MRKGQKKIMEMRISSGEMCLLRICRIRKLVLPLVKRVMKQKRRQTIELLVRTRSVHSREERQGNRGKNASAELNVVLTFDGMESMAIQSHKMMNKEASKIRKRCPLDALCGTKEFLERHCVVR